MCHSENKCSDKQNKNRWGLAKLMIQHNIKNIDALKL